MANNIYYPGAIHNDHSRNITIGTVSGTSLDHLLKEFLAEDVAETTACEIISDFPSPPLTWQQILKDYAVPDDKCKKSHGWHNVRIAMYIKALEDVHLLNITERQADKAPVFYQTLSEIFGYPIIQSSVEWQINHFHETTNNKNIYETDILPTIQSVVKAA